MKSGKLFYSICFLLVFLVSACQEGKEKKEDYSGVSDLISERNKSRHVTVEKNTVKQTYSNSAEEKTGSLKPDPDSKAEDISSIVLYEEKVDIIGSESRRTLAKGLAYINKQGQIVRIKILKE
nr:hypothetical protein [Desulfobacula sp.]